QVDMLDRPFALEIDADLRRVADGENGPLLAVAEVEVDLAVAGQPGLAEFVGREGETQRIETEVPSQQRPQAGARRTEGAGHLRGEESARGRSLVIGQQGLTIAIDHRPTLQPP